jgi:mannose-6-phosphate isomerase-like protein (cupin superfamily)
MGKPVIRNWRDVGPRVGHENAIVWRLLNPAHGGRAEPGAVADDAQAAACLQRITGLARHALQGGKRSDYHVHPNAEQVYYILRGRGALIVDGERYPVREGDVVYLPPGVYHQAVNESDDWMEHLIITARLD